MIPAPMARADAEVLSAEDWLLRADIADPRETGYAEALMHLANGYLGLRPAADPDDPHGDPGFFAADLYDSGIGVSREIVNLPIPPGVRVRLGAHAFRPSGPVRRILDLRQGFAQMRRPMIAPDGTSATLTTVMLAHAGTAELGLTLCRLDLDDDLEAIDLDVFWDNSHGNSYLGGVIPSLRLFHIDVRETEFRAAGLRLSCATTGTGQAVTLASAVRCDGESARHPMRERHRHGQTITVRPRDRTVLFDIAWTVAVGDARLTDPAQVDAAQAFARHVAIWRRRWEESDISIVGDPTAQSTIRYAQFHLMQNELPIRPRKVSPARGLSAAFHAGAVFFDTEIHKDAYWTWCDPQVARSHLEFRYSTLPAARAYAADTGFLGARFPEAVDDLGGEAGPLAVSVYGRPGPPVQRHGRQVMHVSAAVAYAVARYHEVTGDHEFMGEFGCELVLDTARFAASVFRREGDHYTSPSVMGVDEYHHGVTNNHYTNAMLRWTIRYALSLLDADPFRAAARTRAELGISEEEIARWRRVEKLVRLPFLPGGVPAQDDQYASLPECPRRAPLSGPAPRLRPEEAALATAAANFPTNLVKQADVLLLCHLLPDLYDEQTTRAAYRFYERRTAHGSSLSAGAHGVVAARVGLRDEAYAFLMTAGRFNLDYTPRTHYRNGLHLSAYAGAWQVIVEGFFGVRVEPGGVLEFRPRLPAGWTRLVVPLRFRGTRFRVIAAGDLFEIEPLAGPELAVRIDGKVHQVRAGQVMRYDLGRR